MQTQKPGKRPKPLLKKAVRFIAGLVIIGTAASGIYGSYLYADYLQLEQKSAELPGLHLYSVQESRSSNAYSWYASFPKLDEPVFDRTVSKLVNDAKAAFLARVNFQATTEYPADDLNVSFDVASYDSRKLVVDMTKSQTLKGDSSTQNTRITYDRLAKKVVSLKAEAAALPLDEPGIMQATDAIKPNVDCQKTKCIALTFNDGPNPETSRILDTLKTYKAKATFFEIGAQAKLYPTIARRTANEGHAIGMLGENHRNLLAAPLPDAMNDLRKGSDAIKTASGMRPSLARAPYGAIDSKLANKLSMPFVGWSTADQDESNNSQNVYDQVMTSVHSGSIVMSRDTQPATADAYTRIVPDLMKQGYKLVTVPELLSNKELSPGLYNGS